MKFIPTSDGDQAIYEGLCIFIVITKGGHHINESHGQLLTYEGHHT